MDWLDIKEFIKDTFGYIVIIVVVLVLAIYVVGLQQVVGPSMSPTLSSNDIVILDKISYKFSDIKREDIVSVYYADTKYLIKRVIGLPGDKVEFKENKLYINDKVYEEDYLDSSVVTTDFSLLVLGSNVVPEDMYLVLGDNRGDSLDSRDPKVGFIKKKDVIGKVRLKLWPINEFKFL